MAESRRGHRTVHALRTFIVAASLTPFVSAVHAEIDGHGPDAWRVTGVTANDRLNARMGPGATYPVIEVFDHDERGLQQITCVPFYTAAHYMEMTQAQIDALPPRWCLMRNQSMSKAGWVAQRYLVPDDTASDTAPTATSGQPAHDPYAANPDHDPVDQAVDLVREIYERQFLSEGGSLVGPLDPSVAHGYFTDDIVAWLTSGDVGAHPLYGAQDFDGSVDEPMPAPDHPMLRGMITINVDFTNFRQKQRAVFYLRADTSKAGAPLRIFRVEHDGWSYP